MNTRIKLQPKSPGSQRKQRGYLLIETMVSLLIAGVGITGLSTAITDATRVGTSAQQSSLVTIAQRSILSQLRLFLAATPATSNLYRFRSSSSTVSTQGISLDRELQQQVDLLAPSFADIHSTVECRTSEITTCEVCFHWYNGARRSDPQTVQDIQQGATNRSTCQIQIV